MPKYSQVFLKNTKTAQNIVLEFEKHTPYDKKILEIGPGKGILTQYLIKKYPQYWAVEIDKNMVEFLREKFKGIKIINTDILKYEISDFSYFIGNLPYHISTKITEKIVSNKKFRVGVFMFQKEVAKKIVADESKTEYGYLSALVNINNETKYLFDVYKTEFSPKPLIDSGVVLIKSKEQKIQKNEFEKYKKFISMAFSHKRKTLINSISLSSDIDKNIIIKKLNTIPPQTRAEELPPKKLFELAMNFYNDKT